MRLLKFLFIVIGLMGLIASTIPMVAVAMAWRDITVIFSVKLIITYIFSLFLIYFSTRKNPATFNCVYYLAPIPLVASYAFIFSFGDYFAGFNDFQKILVFASVLILMQGMLSCLIYYFLANKR